jgi:hypothetical protein
MLGVSWRDRDTATPERRLKLLTSAAEVCAWVMLITWALARKRIVRVTELPEVARNPTTSRPACGPISTGCDRTGFHSGAAAGAEPNTKPKNPDMAAWSSGTLICLMDGSLATKGGPKCEPRQ